MALKRLHSKITENNINIKNNIKAIIRADSKAINKIFMNLIGNAINYIRQNAKNEIILTSEKNCNGFVFSVRDNGIGIPDNMKKLVFTKFKRGDNVKNIKGAGLGLAIVKDLTEAHGGQIWFESELGTGSTFYFFLPT